MVPGMPHVKSHRREKAAQTRATIIEAAHAEFLESGYHGATIAGRPPRRGGHPDGVLRVPHQGRADQRRDRRCSHGARTEEVPPELGRWWQDMSPPGSGRRLVPTLHPRRGPGLRAASAVSLVLARRRSTDDELRGPHQQHEQLQRTVSDPCVESLAAKGRCATDSTSTRRPTSSSLSTATAPTTSSGPTTAGATASVVDWLADTLPALAAAVGRLGCHVTTYNLASLLENSAPKYPDRRRSSPATPADLRPGQRAPTRWPTCWSPGASGPATRWRSAAPTCRTSRSSTSASSRRAPRWCR